MLTTPHPPLTVDALDRATPLNRRVLVVDDNPAIHEDLRKILCAGELESSALSVMEDELFGDQPAPLPAGHTFELTSAYQGQEGLARVEESVRNLKPYAMAFVDGRMPPGWDGIETIERLWQIDPQLQIVICSAYSDHSWADIARRLGHRDGLLVLRKPFEMIEALQMASALTRKWTSSRQLQRRMDEYVELHRFREEMSALLVHDLKNPLTALLSSIEFATETLTDAPIDPEVRLALDDSRCAGQRILHLLGNLLTVAGAEAGRLKLRRAEVSLASLLADVVAQRRSLARTRGVKIELNVTGDPIALLDPDLVTRALENIVDNALRHTPRGGEIVVAAEGAEGGVAISIGNSGPPIAVDARSLIFEKFGRGPERAGRMNLGLGLYFCRLVFEAHGGSINVEETERLPTLFRMHLRSAAQEGAGGELDPGLQMKGPELPR